MLDSFDPLTSVHTTIYPVHLSVALSFILDVRPSIYISALPFKNALPILSVVCIFAFIEVTLLVIFALLLPPFALAMLVTILKNPCISISVDPHVLPVSLWLPKEILADVDVPVAEEISPVSVSQAGFPLALVFIAVPPNMHSVPIGLAVLPLSNVRIFIYSFPDPISLLLPLDPLAVIDFSVLPGVDTFSVCLPVQELALVSIQIDELFKASATALVSLPFSLVDPLGIINYDSFAVSLSALQLSPID